MPTFRQRPLTWLFFIAAACWATADAMHGSGTMALAMILSAQLYVVGAWAAVGKTHRLVRGAMLFAMPLAAGFAMYLLRASSLEVSTVLGFAMLVSGGSFFSAAITSFAIREIVPPDSSQKSSWRISISEILGWTTVTAIGSFAVTNSHLPPDMELNIFLALLGSTIPAGIMAALFLVPQPRYDRVATVLSAVAVGAFHILANVWGDGLGDTFSLTVCLFAYIAIWILCVRLDEQASAMKMETAAVDEDPTPLKIHAEPSHDD